MEDSDSQMEIRLRVYQIIHFLPYLQMIISYDYVETNVYPQNITEYTNLLKLNFKKL